MNAGWDFALVALFGLLVGVGELVSRYRDAPWHAVRNLASTAYLSVNAVAAVVALALVRAFDATFGAQGPAEQRSLQILVSGFGAIALLRTSLFVIRVGGRDVGVGPVTLLQVLLFATDRGVDRRRAVQRARAVTQALRGLSYAQVGEALPTYCFTLMQNVSETEEREVQRHLQDISTSGMEDSLKVNAVGLVLMNVVGQSVLTAAAETARSRLLERGVLGEVYPRLYEVVRETERAEHRVLDVLGLTLHTAWPNVKAWIEEQPCLVDGWTIRLRVIDPAVLGRGGPGWFDPCWANEVAGVLTDVRKYTEDHGTELRRRGIDLSISSYAMVPALHGFRTAGGAYFLSFARWDADTGVLGRPHQSYEFLPADDDSPRLRQYKELFDNWLRRADEVPPP